MHAINGIRFCCPDELDQFLKWQGWVATGGKLLASAMGRCRSTAKWNTGRAAACRWRSGRFEGETPWSGRTSGGFKLAAAEQQRSKRAQTGDRRQLEDAQTCAQTRDWMSTFLPLIADTPDDRHLVVAPPFTAISTLADVGAGSRVEISSQNVHWEGHGAYTAEISPAMLQEHGVRYAIVGHSEPRKYFSESDEQINHRARSAQANDLIPIVCVGESDEQRSRGEAERVIRRQVEQGLEGLDPARLVVAYEPIWAIGTGKTCESTEANRICGLIRSWVGSPDLIIQYGGSVKPANIDELMGMSDIDGVLVGGASLDPESFARIANYRQV